eukprot:355181-Chlamydomonas_euryale.AAC.10
MWAGGGMRTGGASCGACVEAWRKGRGPARGVHVVVWLKCETCAGQGPICHPTRASARRLLPLLSSP